MPGSPQLQKIWVLLEQKEYQQALEDLQAMLDRLQGAELREAHQLMGTLCYRQQQYSPASSWFRKACQGSDQASDWLNLAISATMQGDLELGAEAFEQVRICQKAAKYSQQPGFYLQLYWYACALCERGEYAGLQLLLDELAHVYRRMHRTDTTSLYIQRLPFFSNVLSLATRCFREQKKYSEGITWLQTLAEALDDEGRQQVEQAMRELQAGNA